MVTLLISSVLFIGLIALVIYFWQKPSNTSEFPPLPPENARGLFETTPSPEILSSGNSNALIPEIRVRASQGDKNALREAKQISDQFYDETLSRLVDNAHERALISLVSYVTRHELAVNKKLAAAVVRSWRLTPDRINTTKMLHIAALSDDANTYRDAVEAALGLWREGKIADLSATEFQALLTGEFWVLSSGTRSSGAGFLLKRTLSSARRELQATTTSHSTPPLN